MIWENGNGESEKNNSLFVPSSFFFAFSSSPLFLSF